MDDNQSTQQSSQQRSNLQLARARRRGSAKSSTLLNSVLAVLCSPWLLWPLLWLILLLVATLSIFSLTFAGFVDRPESAPLVVQVPDAVITGSDRLVIWVVGAIVICAAGYWVVFRQLKGSSQPKRKHQRRQRRSRNRKQQLQMLLAQQPSAVPRVKPPIVIEPEISPTPKPPVVEVAEPHSFEPTVVEVLDSNGSREDPVITILPPEDAQQVDVEKVALAEMMDIRKRRSLSSILGKTYDEETEE
ncbi:hypothetical protein [Chroogloeocystis siderophila]|jgi:hypothetical protein|uniref:Uncharacterized protein n=1 Tax=Chroogloeocystis siderophila 5.2 s.c.1 TaxID=247279 RepID=A0A1U7HS74_9CHRO|nr:hypothetical protein [Chroogloeocystis siderophila]OKH26432.1 hypothetical protein NIES1031_11870 [Chroogloeocystis siderophila 5.2 s.c.1]